MALIDGFREVVDPVSRGTSPVVNAATKTALGDPKELVGLCRKIRQARVDLLDRASQNQCLATRDLTALLVQRGELLPCSAFAARLNWTRQALSKALAARRVFFIDHHGVRLYPAFYGDPSLERRHLHAVTRLLGDLPGGSQWSFFTTPKGSLSGRTPLEALRRGEFSAVKEAAAGFAER